MTVNWDACPTKCKDTLKPTFLSNSTIFYSTTESQPAFHSWNLQSHQDAEVGVNNADSLVEGCSGMRLLTRSAEVVAFTGGTTLQMPVQQKHEPRLVSRSQDVTLEIASK